MNLEGAAAGRPIGGKHCRQDAGSTLAAPWLRCRAQSKEPPGKLRHVCHQNLTSSRAARDGGEVRPLAQIVRRHQLIRRCRGTHTAQNQRRIPCTGHCSLYPRPLLPDHGQHSGQGNIARAIESEDSPIASRISFLRRRNHKSDGRCSSNIGPSIRRCLLLPLISKPIPIR